MARTVPTLVVTAREGFPVIPKQATALMVVTQDGSPSCAMNVSHPDFVTKPKDF